MSTDTKTPAFRILNENLTLAREQRKTANETEYIPESQISQQQQQQPTPYGQRLVINVIDQTAAADPGREWLSIPRSSEPEDGWRVVTFGEFANAINRIAQRMLEVCGVPAPNSFPTIAYIGPSDVRYAIIIAAAVKAGYKACLVPLILVDITPTV
jgi:hypothetical protein